MSDRKKAETAADEVLDEFEDAETRPGNRQEHEGDAADAMTPNVRAQEASQGRGDGRTGDDRGRSARRGG
ncbi:hypothetical protein AB0K09_21280 [Streptomyces sp. NPDC049577]|uniref:hypothetical protein n=1 Tax=Streptomyces sp. NPDC049577 TaxID=3155153 RepID=UPI0034393626